MRYRSYHFRSEWKLTAPVEKVWQVITATPFSWPQWWEELSELETLEVHEAIVGTRFNCTFKARMGYKLRCSFVVTGADYPHTIAFSANGDLQGTATWEFREKTGMTFIAIDWQVATTKTWMNLLGPVLKPLFITNHHRVMSSGEDGLNALLSA